MAKKKEGKVLVWKDDKGTYKLGYSQYLQKRMLNVNMLLLVCVIILIIMLAVGFVYADSLIQRIDALDIFSQAAAFLHF